MILVDTSVWVAHLRNGAPLLATPRWSTAAY